MARPSVSFPTGSPWMASPASRSRVWGSWAFWCFLKAATRARVRFLSTPQWMSLVWSSTTRAQAWSGSKKANRDAEAAICRIFFPFLMIFLTSCL